MAQFEAAFDFEGSAIRLTSGEYFQPLKQGKLRWTMRRPCAYRAAGEFDFMSLYQLSDGRFILVEYSCCERQYIRASDGLTAMWVGSVARAEPVSPEHALTLIVDWKLTIPRELETLLEDLAAAQYGKAARPKPEKRSFDYWLKRKLLGHVHRCKAHEVNFRETARSIYHFALAVYHLIQDRQDGVSVDNVEPLRDLGDVLYRRYAVETAKWWGPIDKLPPRDVDLLDAPWPETDRYIRKLLIDLRTPLSGPLSVFAAMHKGDDYPTKEELDHAWSTLAARQSEIEVPLTLLQQAIIRPITAEQAAECATEEEGLCGCPTDRQFEAWRLYHIADDLQTTIAKKLNISQSTVCKDIQRVMIFLNDNIIPERFKSASPDVINWDPAMLDMGPNKENRTPRQRNRSDE